MDVFDPVETLDREALEALQLDRLRETLGRVAAVPFYADRLAAAGLSAESLKSLDDLKRLPFTTKDDLRAAYPAGLLARPMTDMVRVHTSSGTTGTAIAIFHTRNDIAVWADLMARCMHMVGLRPNDVFQNASGYGLFTGGLGIHAGAERLGCCTIPAGAGNTHRQIRLIRDFGVTGIHIIPSYALYLAEALEHEGIDPDTLGLRIALIGAEPHSEATRQRIEKGLRVRAFNSYGLSEMNGPGVAFECENQTGLHVWEDAFLFEVVDPTSGEPVADGETGELVMTTLRREGMPILRYRTRDLTRILPGPCACGRHHRRIDRIAGRADDMLILKGVNIYPMQIEKVLMTFAEVGKNYQIVLERQGVVERIRVRAAVTEAVLHGSSGALEGLRRQILASLRDEILVTPVVELVAEAEVPRAEGKAKRVIDLRG